MKNHRLYNKITALMLGVFLVAGDVMPAMAATPVQEIFTETIVEGDDEVVTETIVEDDGEVISETVVEGEDPSGALQEGTSLSTAGNASSGVASGTGTNAGGTAASSGLKVGYVDLSDRILQAGGFPTAKDTGLSGDGYDRVEALNAVPTTEQNLNIDLAMADIYEGLQNKAENIVLDSYDILKTDAMDVYCSVMNSHPELFYVASGCGYSAYPNSNYIYALYPCYHDGSAGDKYPANFYPANASAQFDAKVDEVLSGIDSNWTDMEKALYLHDWLVTHCEYDLTYTYRDAYCAMVVGSSVCQGYALAYEYLLQQVGIEGQYVSSKELNHAWNILTLNGKTGNEGEWYYVDCTWDDPTGTDENYCGHKNFLRSRDVMYAAKADGGTGHTATDWTGGEDASNVYNSISGDTKYDNYFWTDMTCAVPVIGHNSMVIEQGTTASSYNGRLIDLRTGTGNAAYPVASGRWYVVGSTMSYYDGNYAGIVAVGDKFYYSTPDSIYSFDSDGSQKLVKTLSDAEKAKGWIYSMSSNGNVITYNIAASPNDGTVATGTYTVPVDTTVPVTDVSLDKTSATIYVDESLTLNATVVPENASNKQVTWSSSNEEVATVNSAGLVTPKSAGTANITVTTKDGNKTATCALTVNNRIVNVSEISLNITSAELTTGSALQLTPTVLPANATNPEVEWSTSDDSVATVSATGLVEAVSAGSATITVAATDDSNKSATCTITVVNPEVSVTGVSLSQTTASLDTGDTLELTASILPENATNKTVTWSSSDANKAVVTPSPNDPLKATVSTLSSGTATITVTSSDGQKTASCVLTITDPVVNVTGVTLNKNTATLLTGETLELLATVSPEDATTKTVTWSSNKTSVATVSTGGVVTAKGPGEATITVTTDDGSFTATCVVTVNNPVINVTAITVSGTVTVIETGKTTTLTANIEPSNATDKTYTWSSSDTTVATVSSAGVVTGKKAGNVSIIATATDGGLQAAYTLQVKDPVINVTGVTLDKTTASLETGKTLTLTATVAPSNATNKTVVWSSANTEIATVSGGVVTAVSAGKVKIFATTVDGNKKAECEITISDPVIAVTGVSLDKPSAAITTGSSLTLTPTVLPENATNKKVSWKSSNENVATVTQGGSVTAVKAGDATITVTTEDGSKTATCVLTITDPAVAVEGISLNKTTADLLVGDTLSLVPTVTPANASNPHVNWTTSSEAVATVDGEGLVKATGAGTATITATTSDGGKKARCVVTVTVPVIHVTGITLDNTSAELTRGSTLTLTPTVSPANATDRSVTWSSSNTELATVSATGVVTAKKDGNVTITATTTDGSKQATCALTIVPPAVPVISISLDTTSATLTVGQVLGLTPSIIPVDASNQNINWTTSNESVATITNEGIVEAKGAGKATITATTSDGFKEATCVVTVNKPVVHVTKISLNKDYADLETGASLELTATVEPLDADDKTVIWGSSDASVASVSDQGVVKAKKEGSATITAKTKDGNKTATCRLVIKDPVEIIELTDFTLGATTLTLDPGEYTYLEVTRIPEDATDDVTFTSTNTSVATVDAGGRITAVSSGEAKIKVSGAGKEKECKVTVNERLTSVKLDKTNESLKVDETLTLTASVTPATIAATYEWTVSSEGTVSISPSADGRSATIKATNPGDVTVTVTATDNNGKSVVTKTATATVSVIKKESIVLDSGFIILGIQESYQFAGQPVIPDIQVYTLSGVRLVANKEYTVSCTSNKAPGTGYLIVTGKGNYSGKSEKVSFNIVRAQTGTQSIKKATINGIETSYPFTGDTVEPDNLTVILNDVLLKEDTDYIVSYKNHIDAGVAIVTIEGIGNYKDAVTRKFRITPVDISKTTIADIEAVYKAGGAKPIPVITYGTYDLKYGVDYKVTWKNSAGSGKMTISGLGNFNKKTQREYNIDSSDLAETTMAVNDVKYKANAKSSTFMSKVKIYDTDGKLLKAGKDYVLTYEVIGEEDTFELTTTTPKNSVHSGDQIVVTANPGPSGNYGGDITEVYYVKDDVNPISKAKLVKIPAQEYTGEEVTPDISFTGLVEDTDFTVVMYCNNINKGTGYALVKGLNEYSGARLVSFKIVAKKMKK